MNTYGIAGGGSTSRTNLKGIAMAFVGYVFWTKEALKPFVLIQIIIITNGTFCVSSNSTIWEEIITTLIEMYLRGIPYCYH